MTGGVLTPAYSAISLYCGAGGLDLGFTRAGFNVRWAIDSDRFAIETYNANLEPYGFCGDVLKVDPPTGISPDLVIGGPPCQGFSVIGRMDPNDPRSQHVDHFFDVVEALRPRAFVMENVKALGASPRWEHIRTRLLDRAEKLGYNRSLFLLNAHDYGVPQSRERMFLVALLDGSPERPTPTTVERPPTVRSALSHLPRFGEPGNDESCAAQVIPARSPIMRPSAFHGKAPGRDLFVRCDGKGRDPARRAQRVAHETCVVGGARRRAEGPTGLCGLLRRTQQGHPGSLLMVGFVPPSKRL